MTNGNVIVLAHGGRSQDRGTKVGAFKLISDANNLTAENLKQGRDSRFVLVPNRSASEDARKGFDGRLVLTDRAKDEPFYASWTGTFFAHGAAGEPLPSTIHYSDRHSTWVLGVPQEAVGLKNVILAINHGFKADGSPLILSHTVGIVNKTQRIEITDSSKFRIIENFPAAERGWFLTDPVFGIPVGEEVGPSNPDARYIWRISGEKIGLIARGFINFGDTGVRGVNFDDPPSKRLGGLAIQTGFPPRD